MRGPDLMPFGATVVHSLAPHSNVLALPETRGKPDYFPHLAGRVVPVAVSGAELVRKHGQLVGVRRLLGLGRAPWLTSWFGLGHRASGILPPSVTCLRVAKGHVQPASSVVTHRPNMTPHAQATSRRCPLCVRCPNTGVRRPWSLWRSKNIFRSETAFTMLTAAELGIACGLHWMLGAAAAAYRTSRRTTSHSSSSATGRYPQQLVAVGPSHSYGNEGIQPTAHT
jgi:hypothetical protein